MPQNPRFYVWGYQPHYRLQLEIDAKNIFKLLDAAFVPKVLLLGFSQQATGNQPTVCIDPDDCGHDPTEFSEVPEIAAKLQKVGIETIWLHSSPEVAEIFEEREQRSYLKKAVEIVLAQRISHSNLISFCGFPQTINNFHVVPVLQLQKNVYDKLFRLSRDHQIGERGTYSRSLADALATCFLSAASDNLRKNNAGSDVTSLFYEPGEALRAAGAELMYAPASAGKNLDGFHGLFEACNAISALRYEGEEGVGRLIVIRRDHPETDVSITLKAPVPLRNFKAVRKLLQVCGSSLALITDSAYVYALGNLCTTYNSASEDAFVVEFFGHHQWRLRYAAGVMMEVIFGTPRLPKPRLGREVFEVLLHRIFGKIEAIDSDRLWRVVDSAIEQKRGTMLIISDAAATESSRLGNQSTRIAPLTITPEIMRMVSCIDGAVIVDTHATCHAIGAILDGMASKRGTPSRGARFNSAVRYIDTAQSKTIAVVVSEDGDVDLLPDLMPQITKSDLEVHIAELERIRDAETIDRKSFYREIEWLQGRQFYLSADMCKRVNSAKQKCYKLITAEPDNTWTVMYDDVAPNAEMNDTFFLPESNNVGHAT